MGRPRVPGPGPGHHADAGSLGGRTLTWPRDELRVGRGAQVRRAAGEQEDGAGEQDPHGESFAPNRRPVH